MIAETLKSRDAATGIAAAFSNERLVGFGANLQVPIAQQCLWRVCFRERVVAY